MKTYVVTHPSQMGFVSTPAVVQLKRAAGPKTNEGAERDEAGDKDF